MLQTDDFNQPKIVYMEIQTDNPNEGYPFPCFSYDNNRTVVLNTGYIMCSKEFDVRYILGVLNSSLGGFMSKFYVTQLQERQFRMLAQYVAKFPIPKPSESISRQIIDCVVCQINKYSPAIERLINEHVYNLYGLNDTEINFIEHE